VTNIFGRWGEEHEGRKGKGTRGRKKEAKINLCETETETEKEKYETPVVPDNRCTQMPKTGSPTTATKKRQKHFGLEKKRY